MRKTLFSKQNFNIEKVFTFTSIIVLIIFLLIVISLVLTVIIEKNQINNLSLNEILFSLKLTLFTAFISSSFALFTGIPIAYILVYTNFKLNKILDIIIDLPIIISPIATGALLLVFFNTKIGMLIEKLFNGITFTIKGIIIAQFFIIISLAVKFIKNSFESIDFEFITIAKTLGATATRTFFEIIIPLTYKQIISSYLLIFARAISEFGATVIIAGATPMKTETLPIAIFLKIESGDLYTGLVFIGILLFLGFLINFIIKKLVNI